MKRILSLLVFSLFALSSAFAQDGTRVVKGKVVGPDGYGMPGVYILLKEDNTKGAATDFDGNFEMSIPASGDATLQIQMLGFKTKEYVIGATVPKKLEIMLKEDVQELDQVMVVGFATQQKRDITGNVAKVAEEAITKTVAPSFEVAMQGRTPGVQITQASGAPGGAINVRVRGVGSITAGSEPLYVIDGVPVVSGGGGDGGGSIGGSYGYDISPLSDINPEDIESISVLKDAAATAIYGARGSNGVVLVTTKRGKQGQTRFTAGYQFGVSQETNRIDLLDGPQYLEVAKRAAENEFFSSPTGLGQNPYTQSAFQEKIVPVYTGYSQPENPGDLPQLYNYEWVDSKIKSGEPKFNSDPDYRFNNDWVDRLLQRGVTQQADVAIKGGTDRTVFYIGTTYRTEKGIMKGNQFDRLATRFNVDNTATDKLKLGLTIGITYTRNQIVPSSSGGGGRANPGGGFGAAQSSALPIFPVYNIDPDKTYFWPFDGNNIVAASQKSLSDIQRYVYRTVGNVYADYSFTPKLVFRTELGLDYFNQIERIYVSRFLRMTNNIPTARAEDNRVVFQSVNLNNTLAYTMHLDSTKKHELKFLGGQTYTTTLTTNNGAAAEDFANDYVNQVSLGSLPRDLAQNARGNKQEYAFISGFLKTNYKYDERYLAEATARVEGSSRFGENNRWGVFPAGSVGWVISEEGFWKGRVQENDTGFMSKVNFLKLRGSFGITGNGAIDNDLMYNVWQGGSRYLTYPGLVGKRIGDPNVRWERAYQFDAGVVAGFLRDRITTELNYFYKQSYDMLLSFKMAPSSGIPNSRVENAGSLMNQGVEFNVVSKNIYDPLNDDGFKWETEFNMTFLDNKVLDLGGLEPSQVASSLYVQTYVGEQIGTYYLPKHAGYDPQTGLELISGPFFNPNPQDRSQVQYINYELYRTDYDRWVREVYNDKSKWQSFRPNRLAEIDSSFQKMSGKTSLPRFFGGITNNFGYKNWELSVLLTFQYGNYVLDNGQREQSYVSNGYNNLRAEAANWTRKIHYVLPDGEDARIEIKEDGPSGTPTLLYNDIMRQRSTDRFLHDASYIRLKNVRLAYNVPREYCKKIGMNSMMLSISLQNWLTFTNFPGWDPEVMTATGSAQQRNLAGGITYYDLPQVKTVMFGAKFNF